MNSSQYFVKLALALVCLALTAAVIVQGEGRMRQQAAPSQDKADGAAGKSALHLLSEYERNSTDVRELQKTLQAEQAEIQAQIQKRQEEINKGAQSQQIGNNLRKEIAFLALSPAGVVKNQKMKDLLDRNAADAPASSPVAGKAQSTPATSATPANSATPAKK